MVQEKPQMKFERNPCIRFRDNCDTDGRRTTDKSPIPWALLTESSRAKKGHTAISVPTTIQYVETDLRNKNTSEFRTVFLSPLGVPNSQVSLCIQMSFNCSMRHSPDQYHAIGIVTYVFIRADKTMLLSGSCYGRIHCIDGLPLHNFGWTGWRLWYVIYWW